jgi:hypothetical protein
VHMQYRIQWNKLPDCERVHCLLNLEQGWERQQLLLHQRWHCRQHHWLVHVHLMQRRIQWYQLPDCRRLYCLLNLER